MTVPSIVTGPRSTKTSSTVLPAGTSSPPRRTTRLPTPFPVAAAAGSANAGTNAAPTSTTSAIRRISSAPEDRHDRHGLADALEGHRSRFGDRVGTLRLDRGRRREHLSGI